MENSLTGIRYEGNKNLEVLILILMENSLTILPKKN